MGVQIGARRRRYPAPPTGPPPAPSPAPSPAPPPEQPAHPWAKKKANEIGQEHHSIGAAEEGESEKAALLMEVEDEKKGQEKNEKAALQMEVEDEKKGQEKNE